MSKNLALKRHIPDLSSFFFSSKDAFKSTLSLNLSGFEVFGATLTRTCAPAGKPAPVKKGRQGVTKNGETCAGSRRRITGTNERTRYNSRFSLGYRRTSRASRESDSK